MYAAIISLIAVRHGRLSKPKRLGKASVDSNQALPNTVRALGFQMTIIHRFVDGLGWFVVCGGVVGVSLVM
jgi:hypothetical protein